MKGKRKAKPIRTTVLSIAHLTAQGYTCDIVERRIPGTHITKDLFGFIDIVAVRRGEVLGVQTTSASNVASRVRKIAEAEHVGAVRESGMRIVVHGWRKTKAGPVLREVDCS